MSGNHTPSTQAAVPPERGKAESPILSVRNLRIEFESTGATVFAVRGVSFDLRKGRTLGMVGESGCGKSVTAYSVLRLIQPPGKITGGEINYRGADILRMNPEDVRAIRGREIAMIFQEPMISLNPVFTIGFQISEAVMLRHGKDKKESRGIAVEMLTRVGIPDAEKRYRSYPHELSGGMRQRVMIAIALAASPSILIADEPTTALDVTIQAQILDLLMNIQRERDMSMLLITHDLGIVANTADDIAIMYAGEIVESGTVPQIFNAPMHPYTIGLFEAIPRIGESARRLRTIPGMVPSLTSEPQGCVFYPRCFRRADECRENPIPLVEKNSHLVRCVRA